MAIKEKLKAQRQHMEDLDKHMSVYFQLCDIQNANTNNNAATMSLLSLSAQARARKSERFTMLRTNNAGRPIRR